MKSSKEKKTPIMLSKEEIALLKGGERKAPINPKGTWDLISKTNPPHD